MVRRATSNSYQLSLAENEMCAPMHSHQFNAFKKLADEGQGQTPSPPELAPRRARSSSASTSLHRFASWLKVTALFDLRSAHLPWTRITDSEDAETLLPAWLGKRMAGLHGRFGLLLTTGDVLRITTISAAHLSSDGTVLLDVSLDSAGVPEGVDLAWQSKHFLGAPVPGATTATVNLAQVVSAVEFLAVVALDRPRDSETPTADEVIDELDRVAEVAAHGVAATTETSDLPTQEQAEVEAVGSLTVARPKKKKKRKK
jgi:hypothetical protein